MRIAAATPLDLSGPAFVAPGATVDFVVAISPAHPIAGRAELDLTVVSESGDIIGTRSVTIDAAPAAGETLLLPVSVTLATDQPGLATASIALRAGGERQTATLALAIGVAADATPATAPTGNDARGGSGALTGKFETVNNFGGANSVYGATLNLTEPFSGDRSFALTATARANQQGDPPTAAWRDPAYILEAGEIRPNGYTLGLDGIDGVGTNFEQTGPGANLSVTLLTNNDGPNGQPFNVAAAGYTVPAGPVKFKAYAGTVSAGNDPSAVDGVTDVLGETFFGYGIASSAAAGTGLSYSAQGALYRAHGSDGAPFTDHGYRFAVAQTAPTASCSLEDTRLGPFVPQLLLATFYADSEDALGRCTKTFGATEASLDLSVRRTGLPGAPSGINRHVVRGSFTLRERLGAADSLLYTHTQTSTHEASATNPVADLEGRDSLQYTLAARWDEISLGQDVTIVRQAGVRSRRGGASYSFARRLGPVRLEAGLRSDITTADTAQLYFASRERFTTLSTSAGVFSVDGTVSRATNATASVLAFEIPKPMLVERYGLTWRAQPAIDLRFLLEQRYGPLTNSVTGSVTMQRRI